MHHFHFNDPPVVRVVSGVGNNLTLLAPLMEELLVGVRTLTELVFAQSRGAHSGGGVGGACFSWCCSGEM